MPKLRKPIGTSIFIGIVFLVAALVILVTPESLGAQGQIYLEAAVQSGQVEILITGKSIRFTEPMLSLKLRNKSTSSLMIVVRAGLELVSEDPGYADVIVGKESIASFQAGEERSIDLYAFSLDPTRSFPPVEARYSIKGVSGNSELLDLLDRVRERHAESTLAAQLAVWIRAMGYTFERLEDTLEVSLESYRARTLGLLGLPIARPDSTGTSVAPTGERPDNTPSSAAESPVTPQPTPPAPEPIPTVGLVGGAALLIVSVVVAYALSRRQSKPTAEPGKQISQGKPQPRKRVEARCLVCQKPLSQCTCPGSISIEPEKRQPPSKEEGEKLQRVSRLGARLMALDGEQVQQAYDLPTEGSVLLSRAILPFVVILLPAISAPHALLSRNGQLFRIKDLNSSNGTRIDGQKLSASRDAAPDAREVPLQTGAQITFGDVTFTFEENPPRLRDGQGRAYKLPAGDRVIVTRLQLMCIEIRDNSVSAPHALLRREGGQYVVKDLNSGNGTQLGTPSAAGFDYSMISKPTVLEEGRRLRLGRVELEMRSVSDSPDNDVEYIGPYRIISAIGRGGMARVFEGRDRDGQRVAIKVPREDYAYDEMFRQRFAREARIWKGLNHNNIVPILKRGEDKSKEYLEKNKGLPYIAMHYIHGCSLVQLLLAGPPLEERVIMEIIRCVAGALQYAHDQGVVHRDIKPTNILISDEGQVFITDFGIARAVGEATITKSGEVPGTPLYISPEQAAGREGDRRSDIYSLGVVIYQMITGRVPFHGTQPSVVLKKHRSEAPVSPEIIRPGLSKPLIEIVLRCLEKDPKKRYQNAQEIIDKLPLFKSAAPELAGLVAEAEKYTVSIDL